MPRLVKTPLVGVAGLVVLAVLAVELLTGRIDLGQAGVRAAITLGVAVLVDNVALPVARMLVGPKRDDTATRDPNG